MGKEKENIVSDSINSIIKDIFTNNWGVNEYRQFKSVRDGNTFDLIRNINIVDIFR